MTTNNAAVAKAPLWAKREFRWLVIVAIMTLSVVAVVVFEIAPKMKDRGIARVRDVVSGKDAFVPGQPKSNEVLFDGVLDKAKDGLPTDAWDLPWCTVVKHLSTTKEEKFASSPLRVDYRHFAKYADELRGKAVRVTGLLVHSSPLRVERPEAGVEWIHRTYLVDLSGEEGYVVDHLRPPPPVDRRAVVSMDAMFIRMGTYGGGDGVKTAPMLVGYNLREVIEARTTDTWNMGTLAVGLAVMGVFAVILLSARLWRKEPAPMHARPVAIEKQL